MSNFLVAAYVKGFVLYLCLATQGRRSEFIRRATLKGYITTFMALWPRYANVVIPKEYRIQVWAFLLSQEILDVVPLSTARRATHAVEPQCLRLIQEAVYTAKKVFRTNRMQTQMAFLVPFSTSSAARLGAIVESSCYVGSNEALTWGDFTFYLVPNIMNKSRPWLLVKIRVNLVKGYRDVERIYQELLFKPEMKAEDRITCVVLPLLAMALEDDIFAHVGSIEEIMCPESPPTSRIDFSLCPEVKKMVVLRKEVQTESGYEISPTLAPKFDAYNRMLKQLSVVAGFQGNVIKLLLMLSPNLPVEPLSSYDFRASQGNKADTQMGSETRKMLMLHDPNSTVYFVSTVHLNQTTY